MLLVVGARELLRRSHQPGELLPRLEAGRVPLPPFPGAPAPRAIRDGLLAGVGQRIDLAPVDLLGRDQALVLEELERRIDRAGARAPASPGALLELRDHLVAVHWPVVEQRQDGASNIAAADAM